MPESDEKAHSETVAIAENVLCEAFEGDVRLKMETEFDTDQATVLRCCVVESLPGVPQSVIVKKILTADGTEFHPKSPDEMVPRFFNDWAGLEFLSKVSNGDSPAAQFYGGDWEKGLIVIEDLGDGRNFYGSLRGESATAATAELIKLARALGKMHSLTIRKKAVYDNIRDRLGPSEKSPSTTGEWQQLMGKLDAACGRVGVKPRRGTKTEMKTVAAFIAAPGSFLVYTHGDPIPMNALPVGDDRKLFDFEFGEFRHALRDGIYGRVCFPTWYHINRVPNDVVEKMEIAYRAELAKGCPEAADDTLFFRSVVEACAYWAIHSRLNFIEKVWEEDHKWGISTQRQILLLCFDIFGQVSEEFGHLEALGATIRDIAAKLRERWASLEEMPYYPAFR